MERVIKANQVDIRARMALEESRYHMIAEQHLRATKPEHKAKLEQWMNQVNESIVSLGFQLTRKSS
jgi:hypothetical protein